MNRKVVKQIEKPTIMTNVLHIFERIMTSPKIKNNQMWCSLVIIYKHNNCIFIIRVHLILPIRFQLQYVLQQENQIDECKRNKTNSVDDSG